MDLPSPTDERSRTVRNALATAVFTGMLMLAAWLAWSSYDNAVGYRQSTAELIDVTDVQSRWSRDLMNWLSLGLSDAKTEDLARIESLRKRADRQKKQAQNGFFGFLGTSLTAVGLVYLIRRRRSDLALAMLLVSALALAAGLLAPAMAVKAGREVPVIGYVVLYFQSKGIWSTIVELFRPGGSPFIGVPILLFSVLIPILKTLLLMAAVSIGQTRRIRGLTLAHRIGKWSMADVCVVSWLLAFMATERQAFMQAELQVGILFFATYAILSIAAGLLVEYDYRHQGAGH